jgi:hypothetical protein
LELPKTPTLDLDATVTLTVIDSAATVADLVTALRQFSQWRVEAPLDRLEQPVFGDYRGTFREVLRELGSALDLTILVDAEQQRVSFLPLR